MEGKGYTTEAYHLPIILNWRRACDERGLADSQRSLYNNDFLEYLLDDLMPWHRNGPRDFSLLEVNRYDFVDQMQICLHTLILEPLPPLSNRIVLIDIEFNIV